MKSCIIISLDFELKWGLGEYCPSDLGSYRANLEGEVDAARAMLELFQDQEVHATWATVGALACTGWDEYFERAPASPAYRDESLRFRRETATADRGGSLHFAPEAVSAIVATPGQELASHTFSHIYACEEGCKRDDVAADAAAVTAIFQERYGLTPTSLVFPRNQINHTDALQQAGIQRWRRNPSRFSWKTMKGAQQSLLRRGVRMAESFVPVGTLRAPAREMRASYLLRFALPDWAWRLHVDRIARDARGLAPGEALHLWWHPHNMGNNVGANMRRLADMLSRVRDAAPEDCQFATMKESVSD